MSELKASIITVCYNSEKTIEDTLNSIASQVNVELEHIVIDGTSKDNTLNIVKQFPHVSKVVSESDKGIYDAMNKGIVLATGDIIGTLNADDLYIDSNVISTIVSVFENNPEIDACYADLIYVDQNDTNKIIRYWKSKPYEFGLFKKSWMPAHPTFFARKSVYEKFGLFNINFKIAADFELLFRLIEQNKIKTKYIPQVLVKMRLGGTTNKNISNILTQNKEIISILRGNYSDFSLFNFVFTKLQNRLSQFLARPKY